MLRLRVNTPPAFSEVVLADLDAFLIDHAACERKASALALSLVVRYRDRRELVREMIALAQEELDHFAQVMALLDARGLVATPDERDPYVGALRALVRTTTDENLLDRLLVAGIVEARGCERFRLVAEALEEGELKTFYARIAGSEARHHALFVRLARTYFEVPLVQSRLDELLEAEAAIVTKLPLRARLH
ncbi:MAG: tRNA-(ms[2]io[6]A)-hydroxylase [Myxococcota bacterium]